jgi:CRISPR-associated endonuclease/helicase Cas3
MPLQSHSDGKLLIEHLDEVRQAAHKLLLLHPRLYERFWQQMNELIQLHDTGKATRAFQGYIKNPSAYTGSPQDKAHTPLGLLATALLYVFEQRSPDWLIAVGSSVLGHHSGMPSQKDIQDKLSDDWSKVLLRQLEDFPAAALEQVAKLPFSKLGLVPDQKRLWLAAAEYDDAFAALEQAYKKHLALVIQKRLATQFVFSLLLEADKAFLALEGDGRKQYLEYAPVPIGLEKLHAYIASRDATPINHIRQAARAAALERLTTRPVELLTLTLPTGTGKTLTALELALNLRAENTRSIIVVLPFLSIIDQTAKIYQELFGEPNTNTNLLMQSHSLSSRDRADTEDSDSEFLLDTWKSNIIITTFDQLLLALYSSKAKHQLRYHHLPDSIIVLDEVQTLPTHLWHLVSHTFTALCKQFNSTVVAMSATQPGFLEGAFELHPEPADLFAQFSRYTIETQHHAPLSLEEFIGRIQARQPQLEQERLLITLNTRASARAVFEALRRTWGAPCYLLSADITPKDRLAKIAAIKSGDTPCLVVSTQVIEAGVDIDMDRVMRDFAPFDSLIQIAGRCNRNSRKARGIVEVYCLLHESKKPFASFIYTNGTGSPDISLQETRTVLDKYHTLPEEKIYPVVLEYFAQLKTKKNLGDEHTKTWATFKDNLPIHRLLRGEHDQQVQLIVGHQDPLLESEIIKAFELEDRWERRSALRKLASRIAQVMVTVWARKDFHPEHIANPIGAYDASKPFEHRWWIVHPEQYDPDLGIITLRETFL